MAKKQAFLYGNNLMQLSVLRGKTSQPQSTTQSLAKEKT